MKFVYFISYHVAYGSVSGFGNIEGLSPETVTNIDTVNEWARIIARQNNYPSGSVVILHFMPLRVEGA